MKKSVIALSFFISLTCYGQAKDQNESLYEALSVSAVDPRDPGVIGGAYKEKAVGGLVCSVTTVIYPGAEPKYACSFKEGVTPDYERIYEALNVKAENAQNPAAPRRGKAGENGRRFALCKNPSYFSKRKTEIPM